MKVRKLYYVKDLYRIENYLMIRLGVITVQQQIYVFFLNFTPPSSMLNNVIILLDFKTMITDKQLNNNSESITFYNSVYLYGILISKYLLTDL